MASSIISKSLASNIGPLHFKSLNFANSTTASITCEATPGAGSSIFFFGRTGSGSSGNKNFGLITFSGGTAYIQQADTTNPMTVSLDGNTLTLTNVSAWGRICLISEQEWA